MDFIFKIGCPVKSKRRPVNLPPPPAQGDKRNRGDKPTPTLNKVLKKCFKCNSTRHLIRDCPKGDRTDRSNQSEWTGTRENQRVQQNVNQQLNRNRPRQ